MNLLTSYFIAPDESSANKLVAVLNAAGYMETAVMPPNEDAPHWAVTVALTNDADRLRVEERARQFETSFAGFATATGRVWYESDDGAEVEGMLRLLCTRRYAALYWDSFGHGYGFDAWPVTPRGLSALIELMLHQDEHASTLPGEFGGPEFLVIVGSSAESAVNAAGISGEGREQDGDIVRMRWPAVSGDACRRRADVWSTPKNAYLIARDASHANRTAVAIRNAGFTGSIVSEPSKDAPFWSVTVEVTSDADDDKVRALAGKLGTVHAGWSADAKGRVWFQAQSRDIVIEGARVLCDNGYVALLWEPWDGPWILDGWPLTKRGADDVKVFIDTPDQVRLDLHGWTAPRKKPQIFLPTGGIESLGGDFYAQDGFDWVARRRTFSRSSTQLRRMFLELSHRARLDEYRVLIDECNRTKNYPRYFDNVFMDFCNSGVCALPPLSPEDRIQIDSVLCGIGWALGHSWAEHTHLNDTVQRCLAPPPKLELLEHEQTEPSPLKG